MSMATESSLPYAIRQFEIETYVPLSLFGIDVSFTNSASAMVATVIVATLFMLVGTHTARIIPGRAQAAVETAYDFIHTAIVSTVGTNATAHLPFVFTMFIYILFGSLLGLTPFKFTFTSHVIVTFGLAALVFLYTLGLGFRLHGLRFLGLFLPTGTPWFLAPLIVVIEVISYLARPITLAVRLFANVLAGHVIIKLFAEFSAMLTESLGTVGLVLGLLPVAMNVLFFAFEVLVFLVQSYIFALLTCVYIRSSIEAH